jgi:hypothetical protein
LGAIPDRIQAAPLVVHDVPGAVDGIDNHQELGVGFAGAIGKDTPSGILDTLEMRANGPSSPRQVSQKACRTSSTWASIV